ncbi:hypothetical protein ACGFIF_36285 [Kribbella sp. NPDC049174]|uniref:hypothetical protein n=1 Tax=Kribbella sp. NPDC049174 TaxID=3364112 RepID=UPI0037129D3B
MVRGRAWGMAALAVMVVAAAGCGSEEEAPIGTQPPIVTPTFATVKPAADCSGSDLVLPPVSGDEGVSLEASTDDTGTSLLLKNTGSLSVLVIPDAEWTTRVIAAPHANPTDAASKAALAAVAGAGGLQAVTELPPGIPQSQVFIVPPEWAVCGLTDDVRNVASLRYLRDKTTSAEYFVAKGLADQVLARFTPPAKKTSQTLLNCAKGTQQLLKERADLEDVALYAELLNTEGACRSSVKALLSNDERATQQTSSRILNLLERAPRLLENTRLFLALAHR